MYTGDTVHEEEIQDNNYFAKMPLKCGICDVDFTEQQDYNVHFKEHHPEKFVCEFCHKICLTVGSLMQHISKTHEEIKLRIKEYNFESESNKSDALDLILLDMPVNSEKALKKRNSNTFLSTDVNVKRSRNHYVCQVCNETFATNFILKKHTTSVHEFKKSSLNDANSDFDSEIDPLDVTVNLSRMKSNANYLIEKTGKHFKTQHVCQICNEPFNSITKLRKHTISDHQLDCKFCCSTFLQMQELKRHVLAVHEEEKKLKCDRCDSKFARKCDLTRHIKLVHELFHEANRPHKCEKCDAEFTKGNHLKDHITAIHEENRPHKCKKCSLAFSFSTDLINHVSVVHNGKKPYIKHAKT